MICSAIYLPVCGQDKEGNMSNFPNECEACREPTITGFQDGACLPIYPFNIPFTDCIED